MRAATVHALALALCAFSLAPSHASIATCTAQAPAGALPSQSAVVVFDTLAVFDGTCGGAGVSGATTACLGPGVFPGVWCGPVIAPGGSMDCAWVGVASSATALVVGFDLDGDGHLFAPDGPAAALPPGGLDVTGAVTGGWTVANPHAVPARLIAHPSGATASTGDMNIVACL